MKDIIIMCDLYTRLMYTLQFLRMFCLTWPETLSKKQCQCLGWKPIFGFMSNLSSAKIFGMITLASAVKEIWISWVHFWFQTCCNSLLKYLAEFSIFILCRGFSVYSVTKVWKRKKESLLLTVSGLGRMVMVFSPRCSNSDYKLGW